MLNTIIVDTGFWYALIDQDDAYHDKSETVLRSLKQPLITTWPVLTETNYLLQSRVGQHAATQFMAIVGKGLMSWLDLTCAHAQRMTILMEKYADLSMDLADASLVILAEELGHGRILSTDQRDLAAYRWKNHYPFENLLLP